MIEIETLPSSMPYYMIVRIPNLDDDTYRRFEDWAQDVQSALLSELLIMSQQDGTYAVRFELLSEEINNWTLSREIIILSHVSTEFLVLNGEFNYPESADSESFLDLTSTVDAVFGFLEREWLRFM